MLHSKTSISIFCCLAAAAALTLISFSFCAHANETDRQALLVIKSKFLDPSGFTSSWNSTSSNTCQWRGVTCGQRNQRVTMLDLKNQSISGTLSPFIGNLTFLTSINLANNGFHGEIPPQIGNLLSLETLLLANNSFSGQIPTNLTRCSNLIDFHAGKNNLSGEIPPQIGSLLKLQRLSIFTNQLTGELPASVSNLSSLTTFEIDENRFLGRIDSLGQLKNLSFLSIGFNHFSGTLPPSIFNISSLEVITLSENRFVGSLPSGAGVNLPKLREFSTNGNNFTGFLPDWMSNTTSLEKIEFSRNQYIGRLSIDFSRMKNLYWLNVGINNLGTDLDFINLLTNCSKLERLYFNRNKFEDVLPHSLANFSTTIKQIAMGRNYRISGTIPRGMNNLVNLNWLTMDSNQFTGIIPSELGELPNLQLLNVSNNHLEGGIPSSLGNLSLLTYLYLGHNNLKGSVPMSLANFKNLLALSVSNSELIGSFPRQILSIPTLLTLELDNNLFTGPLPPEVNVLKNLMRFDASGNRFSGEIPVSLGSWTNLEYLNLSGNSFLGNIPLSLESLISIKQLDLSRNELTGGIPEYLENLTYLEFLNLSYNHLEGEVPTKGVFSHKTGFSIAGNGKLCGGLGELRLSSCPDKGSKKGSKTRLKLVIPLMVASLLLSVCITIVVCVWRRRYGHTASDMTLMEQQLQVDTYTELCKATDNFSPENKIGEGGFGVVYRGILGENRTVVAIKVINLQRKGASKSFMAECKALRNIRHRNLIKIITICSTVDFEGADFKALVYEFMENGNLDEWLHQRGDQNKHCNLSLAQRLTIAIDVAYAIEYLHQDCRPCIVHADLKPSNVLLDHDLVAHVGDFGLAKLLSTQNPAMVTSTMGIKGTVGYLPPEYGMGSEPSVTGDVYSFGILLLEMFTGNRPTDATFGDGVTLHEFARMALPEKVMDIIDPSLLLEVTTNSVGTIWEDGRARAEDCLTALIRIGVRCSMESPADRMEMRHVVTWLCHARETLSGKRILY